MDPEASSLFSLKRALIKEPFCLELVHRRDEMEKNTSPIPIFNIQYKATSHLLTRKKFNYILKLMNNR